jgi:tRNA pseudouridine38-40 synthase
VIASRIALAVEYNGNGYCGWQRQPHCHSVQAELESALGVVAQTPVTVYCAGRTDTGVHAAAQIVHFETSVERPLRGWTFGVNSHLDAQVAVHWAGRMPMDFHARFSALDRSYRYTILNRAMRPGLESGLLAWVRQPLDAMRMHEAAQAVVGEHDFQSFRSAECQANHAIREIKTIRVYREGARVMIEVTANGFLHNMVRILTGCLTAIGRGEQPVDWMRTLLAARDRRAAGVTAPSTGLCFLQPTYPARFGVPDFSVQSETPWHP